MRFVPGLDAPGADHLFSDDKFFEVPDDFPFDSSKPAAADDTNGRVAENKM